MHSRYRAILFDAGNTLIFPNVQDLAVELAAEGYRITLQDFHIADRAGKEKLDSWLGPRLSGSNFPSRLEMIYWVEYMRVLEQRLDASWTVRGRFLCRVVKTFKTLPFWSRVEPGTGSLLDALRAEGYRLGVISNATGHMRAQLAQLDLARRFDFILDSEVVGIEKPSSAIFRIALEAAEVRADEALFVGDTFSIDVAGAERAGIRGVLFDVTGAYADRRINCERITSLGELARLLGDSAATFALREDPRFATPVVQLGC